MIALYIIYKEEGFGTLDARTLGYFLQLKRFFYAYDVPRVKTSFNYKLGKRPLSILSADPFKSCVLAVAPTRTALKDEEKRVADQVLTLPPEKRNVRELLSRENLIKHGFLNPAIDEVPRRMVKKKLAVAKAPKASLREKARGKRPMKESRNPCDASRGVARTA